MGPEFGHNQTAIAVWLFVATALLLACTAPQLPTATPPLTVAPQAPPHATPMAPTDTPAALAAPTIAPSEPAQPAATSEPAQETPQIVPATPIPQPTPTPTLPPVPSATPRPTPTFTPAPEPTEATPAEDEIAGILPWFDEPPDTVHAIAADIIKTIWNRDAGLGQATAKMQWVSDGVTYEETEMLYAMDKWMLTMPWGSDEGEMARMLAAFTSVWELEPETTGQMQALPWFIDGFADLEWLTFGELAYIARMSDASIGELLASSWVAEGIEHEGPAQDAIYHLGGIAWYDPVTAGRIVTAPWVNDGVNRGEARLIQYIADNVGGMCEDCYYYQYKAPWKTQMLLDLPQAVGEDGDGELLYWLVPVAFQSPDIAQTVVDFANSRSGDLGKYAATALGHLSEWDGALTELANQSWFADGIDDEEAALIAVAGRVLGYNRALYDELLENHYIKSGSSSLPLAGDVNIWILQTAPFPEGEDLLTVLEDAARAGEDLFSVPFPTSDIILLVTSQDQSFASQHYSEYMALTRYPSGEVLSVAHETAHYYFMFRPSWFAEGGANFAEAYMYHLNGTRSLGEYRREVRRRLQRQCGEFENLTHYLPNTKDYPITLRPCDYYMGENLFLGIYDTIGKSAFSSALRDLYQKVRTSSVQSERPFEVLIYETFLEHAPEEKKGAFIEVYQQLHGGPFAYPKNTFPDDHGDESNGATAVIIGEPIGGSIDYTFDLDYFSLEAEAGQAYRVFADVGGLDFMEFKLLHPDGLVSVPIYTGGHFFGDGRVQDYLLDERESLGWKALLSGKYYIVISAGYADGGAYSLKVSLAETE